MADSLRFNPFLRPPTGFYPGGQRQRLLDQLRHLSHWSRRALLVLGAEGAGKTTLFRQLAEQMSDETTMVAVEARQISGELDVLVVLAEALGVGVADSFSRTALEPLVAEALADIRDADSPFVVLVDDADVLEPDAMRLLLSLAAEHRFRLLLFGLPGLPERIRNASRDLDLAPHEISLVTFSPVDTRQYLEWRFEQAGVKGGTPFSEDQITELYRRSNGVPGELNRIAGQLLARMQDEEQTLSSFRFPATHLYLVAGLAAVVALSFLLLDRVDLTEEVVTESLPLIEEPEIFTPPPPMEVPVEPPATPAAEMATRAEEQPTNTAPGSEPDAGSDLGSERAPQRTAMEPIPAPDGRPEPPIEAAELADASGPKVEPEPVVDLEADPEPTAVSESDAAPAVASRTDLEPAASGAASGTASGTVAGPPVAATGTAQVATAEPTENPAPADARPAAEKPPLTLAAMTDTIVREVPGLKDGAWLLGQEATAFTLQLVTLSSRDGLLRYLRRQTNPDRYAVYARQVGDNLLYVVTYGSYANRPAAEAASRRLPAEVGKIRPWIRSLSDVQRAVSAGR
ncbi:MAG: AAA family ATPase [Pseudomonadota bacterium]